VAHAQKVQLISKSNRKDDRHDAWTLARLARIDPELLGPVRHRSAQAQIHLTVSRARELVSARTALVNAARGLAKSYGQRLRKCGTQQVSRELATELSVELRELLEPLLQEIESLNERIQQYDERMEKIAKESYPQVELLKQTIKPLSRFTPLALPNVDGTSPFRTRSRLASSTCSRTSNSSTDPRPLRLLAAVSVLSTETGGENQKHDEHQENGRWSNHECPLDTAECTMEILARRE
jgi:hypothetical protein